MNPGSFILTADDFARLQRVMYKRLQRHAGNKPLLIALRVLSWAALAYSFLSFMRAQESSLAAKPFIGLAVLAALVAVALFAASATMGNKYILKASVRAGGWFMAPQQVLISELHVLHVSCFGQACIPWSVFVYRSEDERNFYLFVDPGIAFVFPKAAIADPAHQALIRDHIPE